MEVLEPENSIIILNTSIPLAADPAVVFEQGIETVVASISEAARAHTFDVTTKAGYDGIVSLAFRIRSSKGKLDKLGLSLTEGWRDKTNAVNAKRNYLKKELDALEDEIRKPVNEIQAAEAARKAKIETYITSLTDFVTALEQHRVCLEVITSERAKFATRYENAGEYQTKLDALYARLDPAADAAIAELDRKASEKAELERLRKEAAEREIQDRIEAAAAKAREEAKAEAERIAQEEAKKQEAAIAAAAAKAKAEAEAEAEQKAEAERVKQEAALAAERAARERAEADALAAAKASQPRVPTYRSGGLAAMASMDVARKAEGKDIAENALNTIGATIVDATEPTLFEVSPVVQSETGICEVWEQGIVDLMETCGLSQFIAFKVYMAVKGGQITGLGAV